MQNFLNPDIFWPPRNILYHYSRVKNEMEDSFQKHPEYKRMVEARSVALFAVAVNKLFNRSCYMQIVQEDPPDAKIMFKGDSEHKYLDIELVRKVPQDLTGRGIVELLFDTKLNATYSYSAGTVILCHIDRKMETRAWKDIHKAIKQRLSDRDYDVFLIGRTSIDRQEYQVARVFPELDSLVTVDVMQQIKSAEVIPKIHVPIRQKEKYTNNKDLVPFDVPDSFR